MKSEKEIRATLNDLKAHHAEINAIFVEKEKNGQDRRVEFKTQLKIMGQIGLLEWVLSDTLYFCGHCGGEQFVGGSSKQWTCSICGKAHCPPD